MDKAIPTKLVKVDGVTLIAPVSWNPSHDLLKDFPDCCGAGTGLGERLVPDKLLGLRISAACEIHDHDFVVASPTWAAFHAASYRFVQNIYFIIRGKSNWGMGLLRTAMASFYFYFVDTKGARVFKRLKSKQGYVMQ